MKRSWYYMVGGMMLAGILELGRVTPALGQTLIPPTPFPPFLPLTLSQPGSYKLTRNLTVPNANTTAIRITADNVTLDLNGFAILGPVVCTGEPLSCTPNGLGRGIDAAGRSGIVVRNGQVKGMGGSGLFLGRDSQVENVTALSNGGAGIETEHHSTLTHNTANGNGLGGISSVNSTVTNNTANGNGGRGISANLSTLTNNTANGNDSNGIFTSQATVTNNTVNTNGASGIQAPISTVLNNFASDNDGVGLGLSGNSGYANNVLANNNGGGAQVSGGGVQLGGNLCNGVLCP